MANLRDVVGKISALFAGRSAVEKADHSDTSVYNVGRHEAALRILRENEADHTPFITYLRKYDIDIMHGPTGDDRRFGEDMLLDALPQGVRLLTVQESMVNQRFRSMFTERVPAMWLGDEWQAVLRPILARSEMIVSEFTFLSEGVRWELETCRVLNKHLQTVLILPPRQSPFACVDHLKPLDQFPRVLWADQLYRESLSENFVIKDLLERLGKIAALSPNERRQIYAQEDMSSRIPMSFQGVLASYKTRAQDCERRLSGTPADYHSDAEYYYFWDWFRIASVVGVLVNDVKALSLDEAAPELVYAYVKVLEGISHGVVALDEEGSFLTTEATRKIAASLSPLIERIPQGPANFMIRRLAEMVLERVGYSLRST